MPPKLIIFDCDGVLVDSEPITNRILAEDLTRHGLPIDTETCIELFVGGTIKGVFHEARRRGAALPEDWVDRIYEKMFAALAAEATEIPGIKPVLDRLDALGLRYCVASNGPMAKMRITLGKTGIWNRVSDRVFSAHEVGIAKPDPGLFLHAAGKLNTAPADCVVIEDSASGAKAASAAGMRCLGFTRDTPAERLIAHGAHPFDDMADLPGLLSLDG
jgi:HAD superfamily hydrolase (TIGR01509 family)